jgi:hypothetical protein
MTDDTSTTDWASDIQKVIDEDLEQSSRWFHIWWAFYIILTTLMVFGYLTSPSTFPGNTALVHASLINGILGVLGIVGLLMHATTGTVRPPSLKPAAMNMFETTLTRYGSESAGVSVPRDEAEKGKAAEALIERAGIEIAARSWVNKLLAPPAVTILNRAIAPVIVVILSLILWLVYHTGVFAAITLIAGLIITQIQFYTMPTAAMKYVQKTFPQPEA